MYGENDSNSPKTTAFLSSVSSCYYGVNARSNALFLLHVDIDQDVRKRIIITYFPSRKRDYFKRD